MPLSVCDGMATCRSMKHLFSFRKKQSTVSVVRLSGAIAAGARSGLSDQSMAPLLQKAFKKGKPSAVALLINSPGGSPVQSSLIGARIRRLAEETDLPVFAFVEDVAASGGYWLAASADKIFVDQSSVIGSIGVISSGFGLDEFIKSHGISRRVHTAGKSKSMMDPFVPEKEEDVARLKNLLEQIHEVFKTHVTDRRRERIATDIDLFTGDIWVGQNGIDVGLADGIGHLVPVMKGLYGDKVKFRVYGAKKSIFQRFGAHVVNDALSSIEERAEYARYGL